MVRGEKRGKGRADGDESRTQIDEDGTGHKAAARSLGVVNVDALALELRITLESTGLETRRRSAQRPEIVGESGQKHHTRSYLIQAVFLGNALPELLTNLVSIVHKAKGGQQHIHRAQRAKQAKAASRSRSTCGPSHSQTHTLPGQLASAKSHASCIVRGFAVD